MHILAGDGESISPEEAQAVAESKEIADLRKRAGVPEIDPDAMATSYIKKLMACLGKRSTKIAALQEAFDKRKLSETQARILIRKYTSMWSVYPRS